MVNLIAGAKGAGGWLAGGLWCRGLGR